MAWISQFNAPMPVKVVELDGVPLPQLNSWVPVVNYPATRAQFAVVTTGTAGGGVTSVPIAG